MVGGDFWIPVELKSLPPEDCSRAVPVCRFFEGDFGKVLVAAELRGVCAVFFDGGGGEAAAGFRGRFPNVELRFGNCPVLDSVAGLLASPLRFALGGWALPVVVCGSEFQVAVWEAVLRIPFGATASYSDVAVAVGRPGAVRAVGAAVGRNPVPVVVPCHRVVCSSGRLGGFHWGAAAKRRLLAWEAGFARGCRN